jgi:hypothetical protein
VNEDVQSMLSDIYRTVSEESANLTEWEAKFIENIGGLVRNGTSLSPKQDEMLEKIWKKVTGL